MINSNLDPIFHRFQDTATFRSIVRYDPSRSCNVDNLYVIWKPACDFLLVINSNLGRILYCLATIHPWQTNDRRTDRRQPRQRANLLACRLGIGPKSTNRFCAVYWIGKA